MMPEGRPTSTGSYFRFDCVVNLDHGRSNLAGLNWRILSMGRKELHEVIEITCSLHGDGLAWKEHGAWR